MKGRVHNFFERQKYRGGWRRGDSDREEEERGNRDAKGEGREGSDNRISWELIRVKRIRHATMVVTDTDDRASSHTTVLVRVKRGNARI